MCAGELYLMNHYTPKICVSVPDSIVDPVLRYRFYKNEYSKQYRLIHPDRERLKKRKHYEKNREKNIAYTMDYISKNPEKRKIYRENSRPRNREYTKEYRQKNPEKAKHWKDQRRVRLKGGKCDPKGVEFFLRLVRSKDKIPCYYCKNVISGKEAHIDHIVAVSRNGNHASENLAASCSDCNRKKYNKNISEWKREGQQLLQL